MQGLIGRLQDRLITPWVRKPLEKGSMLNKESKFLVQMGVEQPFYLDGFNGRNEYEWTRDKKIAWRLSLREAERMLERVRELFPDALLLEG